MRNVQISAYMIPTEHLGDRMLPELGFDDSALRRVSADAFSPASPLNAREDDEPTLLSRLKKIGMDSPEEFSGLLGTALERSRRLRHAAVIRASDAVRWISSVAVHDPERLLWHIDRLDGVSASSGWAYIAEAEGTRSRFTTARELDELRLMRRLPSEQTWGMYRGTMLESVVREVFYRRYENRFSPDSEALDAARNLRGTPQSPWLIGNPDDIARWSDRGNDYRFVNDFKCPSEKPEPGEATAPEYIAQLHHYALQSGAAGYPVNGFFLTRLYAADDLARMWAEMLDEDPGYLPEVVKQVQFLLKSKSASLDLSIKQVPVDPDLIQRMQIHYDAADRRVLAGRVAPWPRLGPIDIDPERLTRIRQIEPHLTRALAVSKALMTRIDAYKEELRTLLEGVSLAGAKKPVDTLKLTSRSTVDTERALELAIAGGAPREGFYDRAMATTLNQDRLLDHLKQQEVPEDLFKKQGVTVGLASPKSGPLFESMKVLAEKAEFEAVRVIGDVETPVAQQLVSTSDFKG